MFIIYVKHKERLNTSHLLGIESRRSNPNVIRRRANRVANDAATFASNISQKFDTEEKIK
ncbi:MAG: hypothetical protein ACJAV0_001057 [Shewanella sp.]|jgi:hypothetical protein|tara:strand:- start:449 stop:628 length:180 start_codon:yes stop_codon:yes gene_type:complete